MRDRSRTDAGSAPLRSRREVLGLLAAAGGLLLGCARGRVAESTGADGARIRVFPADATPPRERAAPAPLAAGPAGHWERPLLAGTPWETPLTIRSSGEPGPVVLVLGGVHGDEPGAWAAADVVATWRLRRGSLLVVSRANVLAVEGGERTLPGLGDLNRLYPGAPDAALPMARMADAIVGVAREFRVQVLYDMHESWGFFAERTADGDASLGQTVTAGVGPQSPGIARALAARANRRIAPGRERLVARLEVPPDEAVETNSLAVGRSVPGLTSLLVEMGQERQAVERRTELQLLVARTYLESRGML